MAVRGMYGRRLRHEARKDHKDLKDHCGLPDLRGLCAAAVGRFVLPFVSFVLS